MWGKIEGGRRKGMTEEEMVGRHHRLDGHESEQAPGTGDEQGGLAYCSPWGYKESGTTEQLNNTLTLTLLALICVFKMNLLLTVITPFLIFFTTGS